MKIIESFFLGILAACGALVLELVFIIPFDKTVVENQVYSIGIFLLLAVIIEEIFKYIVVIKRIDIFSYGRGIIINSFIAGLGFSLFEIFLIFEKKSLSLEFFYESILGLTLIHVLTFGIIGYFIALGGNSKLLFFKTIFITSSIHFFYNFLILNESRFTEALIFSLLIILTLVTIANLSTINRKLAQ